MGTRTPTFAELVGDEDEFFATYHTRRSLLRRGALAGDPREILSIADMDDIVHQEGMRPSLLRMLGTGHRGRRRLDDAAPGTAPRGKAIEDALAPDKVYAHFRAGKTLIHAGLNHTRPNLRRLCAMLTEKFAAAQRGGRLPDPGRTAGSAGTQRPQRRLRDPAGGDQALAGLGHPREPPPRCRPRLHAGGAGAARTRRLAATGRCALRPVRNPARGRRRGAGLPARDRGGAGASVVAAPVARSWSRSSTPTRSSGRPRTPATIPPR
jgi:hypothetical protein